MRAAPCCDALYPTRHANLASVHDVLRQSGGTGVIMLLGGYRGVGKTHFLNQVAQFCRGHGLLVQQLLASRLETTDEWQRLAGKALQQWVVFAIDDIHTATTAGQHCFERLCDLTLQKQVLIIASYLDDPLRSSSVDVVSHALHRGALLQRLGPTSRHDLEVMLDFFRLSHGGALTCVDRTRLIEMADGNPGLLSELVREFFSGMLDKHLIPKSVRSRVEQLQLRLRPETFRVLQIASVIGRAFSTPLLLDLVDLPVGHVANALQDAHDLNIIHQNSKNEAWLYFSEEATHRCIYHSILAIQRDHLHELIVEALQTKASRMQASVDDYGSTMARHLAATGKYHLAAPHFVDAADAAFEKGESRNALNLYSNALRYIDGAADTWEHVQKRMAASYHRVNDLTSSIPHLDALKAHYSNRRDDRGVLWVLARLLRIYDNCDDQQAASRTFKEFYEIARSLEMTDYVADGYVAWAWHLWFLGQRTDAKCIIRKATVSSADCANSFVPLMIANALMFFEDRRLETTFSMIEEAARLAPQSNYNLYATYLHASDVAWELGNLSLASDYIERSRMAGAVPSVKTDIGEKMASIISMKIAIDRGELQLARDCATVLSKGGCFEDPVAALTTYVGIRMDEPFLVDACFQPDLLSKSIASKNYQWTHLFVRGFAEAMVARGMAKVLRDQLHTLVDSDVPDPRFWISLSVAQYGRTTDFARAKQRISSRTRGATARVAIACLALFETLLAERGGKASLAKTEGMRAAAKFRRLGWSLMVARSLEAGGCSVEAISCYEQCQAWGDVARLSRAKDKGIGSRASRLTRRELDVSSFLERGLSNREIAQSLCISERTAAHHVESILSKLRLRSRWQLIRSG